MKFSIKHPILVTFTCSGKVALLFPTYPCTTWLWIDKTFRDDTAQSPDMMQMARSMSFTARKTTRSKLLVASHQSNVLFRLTICLHNMSNRAREPANSEPTTTRSARPIIDKMIDTIALITYVDRRCIHVYFMENILEDLLKSKVLLWRDIQHNYNS